MVVARRVLDFKNDVTMRVEALGATPGEVLCRVKANPVYTWVDDVAGKQPRDAAV